MMDLQSMCRLCTFKLHKPQNIFTTRGLIDKISKFTDIQIRNGDGLPHSICDLCNIKLQITDDFRHQVGKADNLIRTLALKQSEESNESQKSAFKETSSRQNGASEKFETGNRCLQVSQITHRGPICRERMRLSERKSWRTKLSKNSKFRRRISKKSLIYSYATARSLVASYEALINRCRADGFLEDFAIPSSFVLTDTESEEIDERAARFAAARRRLDERRNMQKFFVEKNISLRNMTSDVPVFDDDSTQRGLQDVISPWVPVDPLNLLRVISVRPLGDEDHDVFSSNNFSGRSTSKIASWKRDVQSCGAPAYPGVGKDLESQSTTECSSSDKNFCEELRPSGPNSFCSTPTLKSNSLESRRDQILPSPIAATKNVPNRAKASGSRQLAAQCPICDRICVNARGLKVHFKIHRALKCQICEAPTETKEKFSEHMQFHVRPIESSATFECLVCKHMFNTKIGLNAHMRVHSKSVSAAKKCPHCTRSFGTLHGYKIHLAKSHSGFETE